ncbi:unnamed protein product [Moneuplotes crassus]|uniref:Uncharacterized protein n=1 Tax=Euplotes crassus TaxID=5936 RepID=A0AAD1Y4D6_EUPCR|nr:unnamed protein product [Moneuplotes crassus]
MNERSIKVREDDYKRDMYESLKNNGILGTIKANTRSKIIDQLREKAKRSGSEAATMKAKLDAKSNNLVFKLCISMINDFLKKNDMAYSISVLIQESGIGTQTLTKTELEDILKLKAEGLIGEDDEATPLEKINTPILTDIVEAMRRGHSIRPNQVTCSVQTDEGEEGLTLDQKLKKLDMKYMEASAAEKVMPYKVLEERMIKYKRECDERVTKEVQAAVAKVREIEISHVRLEEAAAYRTKLAEYSNELDSVHKSKIKELRQRESEVIERCKIKEREVEAAAFEHRQQVLKDLEILRVKEIESKKTVEMELMMIKNEREKLFQKEKEADLKLKDLNLLKVALEKKTSSEIEEFRRRYEGERDDEKRDLHIRKMQLEEDEHRFNLNKDKYLVTEKDKRQLELENSNLKEKLEKISMEHERMSRDYNDIKDQLKVLSNNGLRDNEIITSKTAQAETYENESKTLRELLQAQKDQMKSEKETNDEIISNLRQQLKEQKDINRQIKDQLISESERQMENYKNIHRAEKEKLNSEINSLNRKVECEQHLTKELTIVNDKLVKNKNLGSAYDGADTYFRGDSVNVGVRQADFLTTNGIPLITNIRDPNLGTEYMERQRVWNDLNDASRDVKRDINKIGMVPIAERVIQPYYDIEKDDTPLSDDEPAKKESPHRFDSFAPVSTPSNSKEEYKSEEDPVKRQLAMAEEEQERAQREKQIREQEKENKEIENGRRDQERRDQERRDREKRERKDKEKNFLQYYEPLLKNWRRR